MRQGELNTRYVPVHVLAGEPDHTRCPTCKMPVRIVRRRTGEADHYEPLDTLTIDSVDKELAPISAELDAELQEKRKGKRTVALVGLAATSCSLAPYHHPEIELWSMNEAHAFTWMTRATRWFQVHHTKYYTRDIAKRGVRGHYDWLRRNEWGIPIYMQYHHDEIPNSVAYPIHEVWTRFFKNIRVGNHMPKNFYSSLDYMIAIAMLEGRRGIKKEKRFNRIEIYGFEMSADSEYVEQRASANFWIGYAAASGVELWMPEGCQLLKSNLYGGDEQGEGW